MPDNTKEYCPIYQCPLCGRTIYGKSLNLTETNLEDTFELILFNGKLKGVPYVVMCPHSDGFGLANLCGFILKESIHGNL